MKLILRYCIWWVWNAGCASAVNASILILTVGDDVGYRVPALLWTHGKLDSLSHQRSLRRVSNQEGEGEGWFPEPCHSGKLKYSYIILFGSSSSSSYIIKYMKTWWNRIYIHIYIWMVLMITVVWSSWWTVGEALEKHRPVFQLHISTVRVSDPTDSLCQVMDNIFDMDK